MPETNELMAEWLSLASTRRMSPEIATDTRQARDGRTIYIVRCANGHHESYESYAHALELLVYSFQTRAEDTPEAHAKALTWSHAGIKAARTTCMNIARETREKNPCVKGAELDALVMAALSERATAERNASVPPKPPIHVVEKGRR